MLIRGMIVDKIHNNADIPFLCLVNQLFHILHRPIGGIDRRIISNIIAVIHHRRRIDRCQPDRSNAQGFQIVQLACDARNISLPRAGRIQKALRIYLINYGLLPPLQILHIHPAFHFHQKLTIAVSPARTSWFSLFFICGYSAELVTAMMTVVL